MWMCTTGGDNWKNVNGSLSFYRRVSNRRLTTQPPSSGFKKEQGSGKSRVDFEKETNNGQFKKYRMYKYVEAACAYYVVNTTRAQAAFEKHQQA